MPPDPWTSVGARITEARKPVASGVNAADRPREVAALLASVGPLDDAVFNTVRRRAC